MGPAQNAQLGSEFINVDTIATVGSTAAGAPLPDVACHVWRMLFEVLRGLR